MNTPWHGLSTLHNSESITDDVRHQRACTIAIGILAILGLTASDCPYWKSTPCDNCMTSPQDQQVWSTTACVPHLSPPDCMQGTEVLFAGWVPTQAYATVQAQYATGPSKGTWYNVTSAPSRVVLEGIYWEQAGKLGVYDGPNMSGPWEVAQGSEPATVKNLAHVKAFGGKDPLLSVRTDWLDCAKTYPAGDPVKANCLAPESPVAHVVAVQDFGADCVSLVNQVRATEGVQTKLAAYQDKEGLADYDSKYSYEHCPQSGHCSGTVPQNKWGTFSSYRDLLDKGAWQQMYVDEKPSNGGHYLNMVSTEFDRLACGIHVTDDGLFYAVMNFYKPGQE